MAVIIIKRFSYMLVTMLVVSLAIFFISEVVPIDPAAADPLRVGDMYRLSFDRSMLNLEPLIARCVRCRLVREDSFEAGFSFFQPVDLSALKTSEEDSLFD